MDKKMLAKTIMIGNLKRDKKRNIVIKKLKPIKNQLKDKPMLDNVKDLLYPPPRFNRSRNSIIGNLSFYTLNYWSYFGLDSS